MCINKIINYCAQYIFPHEGRYDPRETNAWQFIEFSTSQTRNSSGNSPSEIQIKPLDHYDTQYAATTHIFKVPNLTIQYLLTPTETVNKYTNGLKMDIRPIDLIAKKGELPEYFDKCLKCQFFNKAQIYDLLTIPNKDCLYSEKPFHFLFYGKRELCKGFILWLEEIGFTEDEVKHVIGASFKYTDACNYCSDLKVFLGDCGFTRYLNGYKNLFGQQKL